MATKENSEFLFFFLRFKHFTGTVMYQLEWKSQYYNIQSSSRSLEVVESSSF